MLASYILLFSLTGNTACVLAPICKQLQYFSSSISFYYLLPNVNKFDLIRFNLIKKCQRTIARDVSKS